ncbi:hypothetical protein DEI89_13110 [Curtobacterium sp. MCBD17_030]|nr:hypothetical protein DEI89_13110 [Curtobacterium sp. MCBD17_030]
MAEPTTHEQQWRVVADRDKGDDMTVPTQQGDRLTWEWTNKHVIGGTRHDELVRIERPATLGNCHCSPTEPMPECHLHGRGAEERRQIDLSTAEPPRIEDMAPGTTFTGDRPKGHLVAEGGQIVRRHGRRFMKLVFLADSELVNDRGELVDADEIDPSTIRDVTPPIA